MRKLILLMNCPDQKGIIASVTNFFHKRGGNIVYIDQYVDRIQNAFFMRIEVEAVLDQDDYEEINSNFQNELGVKFHVKYDFYLNKPQLNFISSHELTSKKKSCIS